jgi:tetratricopeptide (TPR) repeat protein
MLADYYFEKGDFIEALNLYKKAYSIKKDSYVLEKILSIYIYTGQPQKVSKFNKDIKENPILAKSIAIKLLKTKNLNIAEKFIKDNILNIADKNLLMGMLYELKRDIDTALTFYEQAFIFNKKPVYAYSYGRVLEIKGFYRKAIEVYKRAKYDDSKFYKLIKERIKFLEGLENE